MNTKIGDSSTEVAEDTSVEDVAPQIEDQVNDEPLTAEDVQEAYDPKTPISLTVDGHYLTVHKSNTVNAMKCEALRKHIEQTPSDDLFQNIARYSFYAPLAACSTGDVPTEKEYLEMDEIEADKWFQVVYLKNPHWFPDMRETEEVEKKKDE